ncbi:MAG TPA: phage holin family protein [Burkholderiales bacterium]|nr:phage holin family protein [Burkholderiales bacterium]
MKLLLVWVVNTVALLAVAYLMPSVRVESFGTALIAAALLGLANAVLRPILVILTLPVTVLTLGLFIFVINGLIFIGVSQLVPGFEVLGFWHAVGASIVFSLISWLLSSLVQR